MFLDCFIWLFFGTSVLSAVVKERGNISCSLDEFSCGDGACISFDRQCDGLFDCADGSDEAACYSSPNNLPFESPLLSRSARQASGCRKNKWQCRDGTCINFDGKCDGVVDCPDGSDETHPLCRKTQCQYNWFRCTYGACVDGTAPCNGIQECADNSDELLPRCRNETDEARGQFKCQNGEMITAANHCDGVADCSDGSDETVRACAAKTCPSYLFQCAYGACVDQGSDCNGRAECADNSDESPELCGKLPEPVATPKPPKSGNCILPPYPEHGHYVVGGIPNASPGQGFESVNVNFTCNPGYGVNGTSVVICTNGLWSLATFPQCVRFCRLNKHPSVTYRCLITGGSTEGSRDCNAQEPAGTVVRPECKAPNYYFSGVLNFMRCFDGSWDYVAICTPGLAKNGTNITILIKDKVEVYIGDLQYHVPIFNIPNNNHQVVPVTENILDADYDIDEGDWRVGRPSGGVSININNSSVVVNSDGIVNHVRKGY